MLTEHSRVGDGSVARRLSTPRAAAFAGVAFAVLFATSLALLRSVFPGDPFGDSDWAGAGATRLRWALTLAPLAGIAFLWFVGVVRDHFGELEDRFFSTVFLGSALLFLAMVFVSMTFAGALLAGVGEGQVQQYDETTVAFGRAVMLEVSNVYALRMAGVFMISLGTIWLRTGLMPRWIAVLTYVLAAALLFVVSLSLWITMVFPAWVFAVSVGIFVRTRQRAHEDAQGPASGESPHGLTK
jgi:MFS family permease